MTGQPLLPARAPGGAEKLLNVCLGFERARAARIVLQAVDAFEAAPPSGRLAVARRFQADYGHIVPRGLDAKSLYRKSLRARAAESYARSEGLDPAEARARAILGKQLVNRATARGLGANRDFVAHWHDLVSRFNRKSAPACKALLAELASGVPIPGVGTWRDVWATENGGIPPSDGMPCPWGPVTMAAPKGWSWRNIQTLNPPPEVLVAVRKGTGAAYAEFMPLVRQTRAGLASCEVVEFDDLWLEQKVAFPGNRHAQRIVGLVGFDVATAYLFGVLLRPRTEHADGTRETIRQVYMRWEMAHLLCDVGVSARRLQIDCEFGSAAISEDLESAMRDAIGGRFELVVRRGGRHSHPLSPGDWTGTSKGNPRGKPHVEGSHGIVKNLLACLPGSVGGGRGAQPEWATGMDKEDEALRRCVTALAAPGEEDHLLARLAKPYLDWSEFAQKAYAVYDAVNARQVHDLEGWEEQGFVVPMWRRRADETVWHPMSELRDILALLDAESARKLVARIEGAPGLTRQRRMSPAEAWAARAGERIALGPWAAPQILGRSLAQVCTCSPRLELAYKDDLSRATAIVCGVLDDGRALERGEEYLVWINPLNPGTAYVCDRATRWLGTARVVAPSRRGDMTGIARQMATVRAAEADLRRKLAPIAAKRQRDRLREMERNLAILAEAGEGPAPVAAVAATGEADMRDLIASPAGFSPSDATELGDLI